MRNLKVLPDMGGAYPVTGLGEEPAGEPTAMLNWSPQGVSLGQMTHRDGQPVTFGRGRGVLHRAGRP